MANWQQPLKKNKIKVEKPIWILNISFFTYDETLTDDQLRQVLYGFIKTIKLTNDYKRSHIINISSSDERVRKAIKSISFYTEQTGTLYEVYISDLGPKMSTNNTDKYFFETAVS